MMFDDTQVMTMKKAWDEERIQLCKERNEAKEIANEYHVKLSEALATIRKLTQELRRLDSQPRKPEVSHYNDVGIQPIDLIRDRKLSFAEGNVVKYVCRYKGKDGMKDLEKALDYLHWVIEDFKKEEEE